MSHTHLDSHESEIPPDWNSQHTDLSCPLCKYNLRGLITPRCPECGFAFSWRELIDAQKNLHRYLFEHGRGRNVKSFFKTWFWTSLPRRFWRDLNPAQPVVMRRLILYWSIATLMIPILLTTEVPQTAFLNIVPHITRHVPWSDNYFRPGGWRSLTQRQLDAWFPLPWHRGFWTLAYETSHRYYTEQLPHDVFEVGWTVTAIVWPWLTLLTLCIFRFSMRRAKIQLPHLVRAAIYSCDDSLLMLIAFAPLFFFDFPIADGWRILLAAVAASIITSYRLSIAFDKYLRLHRPVATAIASQIIAVLLAFGILLCFADFSRKV